MNVFLMSAGVAVALAVALLLVLGFRSSAKQRAIWKGWDEPDASGLTLFQVKCETALVDLLARRGLELTGRDLEDLGGEPKHHSIRADLGDTPWRIWIDDTEFCLAGPDDGPFHGWLHLASWAYRTPEDLISGVVTHVESVLETLPRVAAQQ